MVDDIAGTNSETPRCASGELKNGPHRLGQANHVERLRHSATSYPVRLRTRDGGVRHLMLSTVLHHDVVYGLAVDVSETHRVVEQLRRSEELTRRILEAMPGGVVHVRKDGAVLRANGEAQRILGLRLDELTQKYVLDFEPETLLGDGSPCSAEDYPVSRALATGEPQPRTLIGVRRPGGGVSWAVFTAVPVKDPDTGETSGAVVTFVDITEHRAAQEALAESEERYRRLVEHSPDPMAIVSQDRLLFVNAAGVDLMARGDLVGTSAMDLVPKERVPEVRAYVDAALEGKRVGTVQADLVRRDGGRVAVELSAAPLVYQGKRATLVVARDIRARRRAEDELSRLQEKFQHTQKLESLGILAGGIAHDFNNLLSAILGNASLAKLHLPDDSRSVRHVAAIEKAAQQAADLTGQMLAYSGRGRLRSEPVDVSAMVAEMIELLTSVVSKKAVVETRFDAPGALVLGDVSQLRQVAMNLLLNASDALDDHPGRIVIRTRLSQLERRQLAESYLDDGLAAGNYLTLEVSDTGRGMDANTVAKVFDPFFTTKSTGRGLGLAATLGIIRAHRGAVEVHSKVGEGTRFSVHLPTSDGLSQIVAEPAAETTVGDASVLVVDDEPMVREVTGAMLEELGYRCQLAASGSEAIRRLRADPADVDVVILDMTMPDMNGVEALAALRAVRPDLPVVLCSGYSEAEVSDRTGGSLANAFLQKPFTTSELIAKLQTALGR